MSKNNSEAFPYPVLTNDEDSDYKQGHFNSEISLEVPSSEDIANADLEINYELDLDNQQISNLIDQSFADYAILVKSKFTGYREIFVFCKEFLYFFFILN